LPNSLTGAGGGFGLRDIRRFSIGPFSGFLKSVILAFVSHFELVFLGGFATI